jgi:hypothetical protein
MLAPAPGRAGSEPGELPEVLGSGGQKEFVPGAVRPAQTRPRAVVDEVRAAQGAVPACVVDHRDVRLDPLLVDEPGQHLGPP